MTDARAALKTAVRLVVEDLGGAVAAAAVVGRNPGRVSEWCARHHEALPSLLEVAALERVAGHPRVTACLAGLAGLALGEVSGPPQPPAAIPLRVGEVMREVGSLVSTASAALADGAVSAEERSLLAAAVSDARVALDRLGGALREDG